MPTTRRRATGADTPPGWGLVARRGARQLTSRTGTYEERRPSAPPTEPSRWVREETGRAPSAAVPTGQVRPLAPLPGDLVTALRAATADQPARARERFVTLTSEAVEAYNRGRYEEAARRLSPVANAAPAVAGVREVAGLANYRARRWRAARGHLGAHAELTGDVTHLPACMDCERALGHPRNVARLFEEVRAASPSPEVLSEARIVQAAALADRGRLRAAIELLVDAGADRKIRNPADRHVRQWYVLADLYERSGDVARARELFTRVADADPSAYDVDERLEELGGRTRTSARRRAR